MSILETQHRSAWRMLAVAACIALAGACDERPPTTPTPQGLAIEGRWTGTMLDRSAGAGVLDVVLMGSGDVGTGTFSLTFADASANLQGLVLARTRDAPSIDLSDQPHHQRARLFRRARVVLLGAADAERQPHVGHRTNRRSAALSCAVAPWS